MRASAVLTVEEGWHAGERRWIRQDEKVSLGSSAWAELVICDDAEVAPVHCVITLTAEGCVATAIDGCQIVVNGTPGSVVELHDMDRLQVGRTQFSVRLEGTTSEPAKAAPVNRPPHPLVAKRQPRIAFTDHDTTFACVEPASSEGSDALRVDGATIAERVSCRIPLFILCRFDRWSFPIPDELAQCRDCVPRSDDPQVARFLPLLFPSTAVKDLRGLVARGLDEGALLGLASTMEFHSLKRYLQRTAGLYLSPKAFQDVLRSTTAGGAGALLGPVSGILVGSNRDWQFYVDRQLIAGPTDLGFSDASAAAHSAPPQVSTSR